MTPRMFAALCVGALGAGAILLPIETFAQSRGAAGPAMGSPGGMRAPIVPPGIVRPPVAPPAAQVPPPAARTLHARPHPRHFPRHRRFVGTGWPWWPYAPYAEPYQTATPYAEPPYPDDQASSDAYPAAPHPPPPASPVVQSVTRVIVVGQGCDRTTETIPWRDGSPRTITMVRC